MRSWRWCSCCVVLATGVVAMLGAGGPDESAGGARLRVVKTEHYEIHTNLGKDFVGELGKRMDVMYETYEKKLSDFHQPAGAGLLPAYLFDSAKDYARFSGSPHSDGVFVSG